MAIFSPEHFYLVLLHLPPKNVHSFEPLDPLLHCSVPTWRPDELPFPPVQHCCSTFCLPIRNMPKSRLDPRYMRTFNCLLLWTILSLFLSCPCYSRYAFLSVFFSHINPNAMIILFHELFFSFLMGLPFNQTKANLDPY